jgi:GT2 family glycosyltransferase
MASLRLAAYIPNLNGGARLTAAVESILAQSHPPDVVVVDNGSTDDSIARARAVCPSLHVLMLGRNVGFGPALNAAVRAHPAETMLFVNNDVECEPQFVPALLDRLGRDRVTVAGVLLQQAQPSLIDSAGVVADRTLLAFDYLYGEPADLAAGAPSPLGPTGGAALVPLDAFNAVGGFDERMFAYLEDLDFGLRLRCAGWRCRLAPDARALHLHSATLGSGSHAKNQLMGFSRGYLLRRYGVLRNPRLATRALAGEVVICAGQAFVDRTLSGIPARFRGWRAARGLPRRTVPVNALLEITLGEALERRSRRRRATQTTSAP